MHVRSDIILFRCSQASAYETCERTRTPLHTPKTLDMLKKSTPCLIKKASRCAADRTSKTTFLSFTFYVTHKDFTRKSCVFICCLIGSVVRIVLHFLYTKEERLRQIKKKHDCGTIVFLTATRLEPTTT